ncbi:pyridoxamine 5'-phosphate oxidase family protein [Actinoalloteichus caeruleus]|uniref:Pyridoxamine 5'-phosphate oxidase n=1 Tax=Actinoalloteichus caeruleus DSM 43889 TaxID=1120930 RepID=A0ABT1JFT1_ACTCY|nr:pyridoxamine 5'-phosphate oxidase family protein [Actinoalloteichus caeruleus]MCP2331355.1 Pyridoxamine 5'-phosphate oxidase [Actinoalloteichus caeruleus DSM 43889]
MAIDEPVAELDPRFSAPDALPTSWLRMEKALRGAETYWLSSVRGDGRPHVSTLLAVWLDGAAYFCTGEDEQKARNIQRSPLCALTTGSNLLNEGLDVVVEGTAEQISEESVLREIADSYLDKYGEAWRFEVRDGRFHGTGGGGNVAVVYRIRPAKILAFDKGGSSQTRWRF